MGGHAACIKYHRNNSQKFNFGGWPNLEWLWRNGGQLKPSVSAKPVAWFVLSYEHGRAVHVTYQWRSHRWARLVMCPPYPRGRVGSRDSCRSEVFLGVGRDGGRTWQQTCVKKQLTAANCLYISGFWGLCPQTPTGAPPLDPAGGLPSLRPRAHPDFTEWLHHCDLH